MDQDQEFALVRTWQAAEFAPSPLPPAAEAEADRAKKELFTEELIPVIDMWLKNTVPDSERDDLLGDITLALVKAIPKFRFESRLRSFALGVARHYVHAYYRKRYRRGEFDPLTHSVADLDGVGPSTAFRELEAHRRLLAAMHRLEVADRELLELHYWHELNSREIGEILALNPATVRGRLAKARERLRKKLTSLSTAQLEDELCAVGTELRPTRKDP